MHLLALPGSPRHDPKHTLDFISQEALKEAEAFVAGEMDGIVIENYGDMPYNPHSVGPEVVSSMTYIVSRIIDKIKIPVGIQVLRNDPMAAISIAHTVGAKFVRMCIPPEEVFTDSGAPRSTAYEIHRFRRLLGAEQVRIVADIDITTYPNGRDIADFAEELSYRGLADNILISGGFTGKKPDTRDLERMKKRKSLSNVPILVGGGLNKDNVEDYLRVADGVVIATSLKVDGISTNPVDPARVREFMRIVNEVRA